MSTNLTRLRNTARFADELWKSERPNYDTNEGLEGLWSLLVIEPILLALEWPRLRQGARSSTGAYFEWPKKNRVDVALLHDGKPRVFAQLKN